MTIYPVDELRIGTTETFLARVTSRDGAGAATGVAGEGKYITAAQVSTIACTVYDRSSTTPDVSIATPTITSSAVIAADTSSTEIWTLGTGYNFLFDCDMATALVATAGRRYRIAFRIVMTTGTKIEFGFEGPAVDVTP